MDELLALGLALGCAWLVDLRGRRLGIDPPGFGDPWRRALALAGLAFALYSGLFLSLAVFGGSLEVDLEMARPVDLFLLHGVFAGALALWAVLGYGGARSRSGRRAPPWGWAAALGLTAARPAREAALGILVGVAAWVGVLALLVVVGSLLWWLGLEDWLPEAPPEIVPWIAAQPVALRLALSATAGLVEEAFFRGFLQLRLGIALSTGMFLLAHLSYEQPFMLVGVFVLSLVFAAVVRWRGNIWAAALAHATFDALQLLIVIPAAVELLE